MADPAARPELTKALDAVTTRVRATLGENLHSLMVYGSAVRGDHVAGVSDLNLLIVLEESTPDAHAALAESLRASGERVEPFVLGRRGLDSSYGAFAIKFRSIGRHYRVLHGADPLAGRTVDEARLRFLCEQALRNLWLRAVHAFVTSGHDERRYGRWLAETVPGIFVDVSEAVRCAGSELAADHAARIPALVQALGPEAEVLRDLLALKEKPRPLGQAEARPLHARTFRLIEKALAFLEERCPPPPTKA